MGDNDGLLSEDRFDFAVFVNDEILATTTPYLPPKYQQHAVGDESRCNGKNTSLYRGMISPDTPKAAFLPTNASEKEDDDDEDNVGAVAQACYLRSVWLSTMLYDEMKLPSHREGRQGHGNSEELLLRDLGLD